MTQEVLLRSISAAGAGGSQELSDWGDGGGGVNKNKTKIKAYMRELQPGPRDTLPPRCSLGALGNSHFHDMF